MPFQHPICLTALLVLTSATAWAQQAFDLQAAIDATPDGGTVQVPSGMHIATSEARIINRNQLTIRFAPHAAFQVDDLNENVLLISASNHITIEHASLSHVVPSPEYRCHGAVVVVQSSSHVTIRDSELNGCGAIGLRGADSAHIRLEHCHLHANSFTALYLMRCDEVQLLANLIERNANTLTTYDCPGLTMTDNLIRDNGGYWDPRRTNPGRRPHPEQGELDRRSDNNQSNSPEEPNSPEQSTRPE